MLTLDVRICQQQTSCPLLLMPHMMLEGVLPSSDPASAQGKAGVLTLGLQSQRRINGPCLLRELVKAIRIACRNLRLQKLQE